MKELWTIEELSALGEVVPATAEADVFGVSIDSRQISKGDLFIALSGDPGPRFKGGVDNPTDGHEFISSAIKNGAGLVLLSKPPANISVPYIKVEDTLDGLWALGALAAKRNSGQTVVITGSAGKTTAKTWLSACLESLCQVHASIGSLNNHWGVPLSLSRMPRDADVNVIEIGTNHSGEIQPLSQLAEPDVAILLNVLPAHIGNFEGIDALRREKLSIADGLSETGIFVLPHALGSGHAREVTFGLEPDADVTAHYQSQGGETLVTATVLGQKIVYKLPEPGEHRVLTSLAVLAAVAKLGLPLDQAAKNLGVIGSPKGRGNKVTAAGVTIVDDSYNANPVSMVYAINSLKGMSGRKFALLGEILELGDEASRFHQEVAEHFSSVDEVITFGQGFAEAPGSKHYESALDLDIADFVRGLKAGDIILVKGSNKVFWQLGFVDKLIEALRQLRE